MEGGGGRRREPRPPQSHAPSGLPSWGLDQQGWGGWGRLRGGRLGQHEGQWWAGKNHKDWTCPCWWQNRLWGVGAGGGTATELCSHGVWTPPSRRVCLLPESQFPHLVNIRSWVRCFLSVLSHSYKNLSPSSRMRKLRPGQSQWDLNSGLPGFGGRCGPAFGVLLRPACREDAIVPATEGCLGARS